MPTETYLNVSKAGELDGDTVWLDRSNVGILLSRGVTPIRVDKANGIACFKASEVRKAFAPEANIEVSKARTPAQRAQWMNDILDNLMSGMQDIAYGRTRTLGGSEAQTALRIGARPIKEMGGGELMFRVVDLDRAAQKLGPSEQALLELQDWYRQGR